MTAEQKEINFFDLKVMGHPAGLFVLFFTEMWERFSYYGMRALLVLFLTTSLIGDNPGWGWPREHALAIYGSYTSLVYLTPILGGYIADRIIGHRWAVLLGALIMTLGHASMALEFDPIFMYIGLGCLVVGNGFFKPNMNSVLSELYKKYPEKKDGAYTIFYMGVNSGSFLGMLLCGYIGESPDWGWSYGFGLAGIFMFIGMLQFYFTQGIFGKIGLKPIKDAQEVQENEDPREAKRNPFSKLDLLLIAFISIVSVVWVINDPVSKISSFNVFNFEVAGIAGENFAILLAFAIFIFIIVKRVSQYTPILRDKIIAVIILAFISIFFWACFEQAGGSMAIFAKDYTLRSLDGSSKLVFNIANTLITLIPLSVISYVLFSLFNKTFKYFAIGNVILSSAFVIIWGLALYMLYNQFQETKSEVPASWFNMFNSLFIITLSPLFSKIWESKYNPLATYKSGIGMILLGIGFAALALGADGIPQGAKTASVSMIWLIVAYLFHTMGEICISPAGLSYVSKLVPARMIAIMFGIWYLGTSIGNKIAGTAGGMIDKVTEQYSMTTFFLIFTLVPMALGLFMIMLTPLMKKLMHGVR
ncbi:peptide MFS transporter [Olivibacter sitiensis]|uniref:peptide MFS transporter n=1 Tax=Olivibacter sitiensis TaxID=376470 RepID=UPI00041FDCB3|nr:oligopeptide:H+ symporter [Olivibacter sitiensis]